MKYNGVDKHAEECVDFIKNYCCVKNEVRDGVSTEIYIHTKDENKQVGVIKGFFREHISGRIIKKYSSRFHIATLGVTSEYQRSFLYNSNIRNSEKEG